MSSNFIFRLCDSEMNIIGFYTDENLAKEAANEICRGKIKLPYEIDSENDMYITIDAITANKIGSIPDLVKNTSITG